MLGTAEYGEPFAAVVGHGNFYGVQSHPEKSSAHGLRLLAELRRASASRASRRIASARDAG